MRIPEIDGNRRFIFLTFLILFLSAGTASAASPQIENGKTITLTYKLFVKGTLLEEADQKTPFTYKHGAKQIVPGLEKGLMGLHVGDQKTIRVTPEEAYGPVDPGAFLEIEKEKLPPDVLPKVGTLLEAKHSSGEVRLVKITEVKEKTAVLDFNHPLAGKELEFQIEVLKIG